ncbi:MAG: nucleotidyltransferase domain-containing protein [Bacilli bacterium]|nr:nucleotidyltransferase domain-containing protein [Bacilli bacterium]
MYQFRVKKNNSDLITKLDSVKNRNEYITNLILNDINPNVLTIKQIRERIAPIMRKYNIKETYLFGSYARGEANRNSDIDLYCDKGDVDTLWKLSAFSNELKEALGKDVDIVTIGTHLDDIFKSEIEKDMLRIC